MSRDEQLHVACVLDSLRTVGPGKRIGLWVEGCGLRCPGCMSLALKERREESSRTVEDVIDMLVRLAPGHDGVTFSGGEPFEQAEALCLVAQELKARTGLDLMVYTGRNVSELAGGTNAQRYLLRLSDIIVDGPYVREKPSRLRWRGSANQSVYLADAGRKYRQVMADERGDEDEVSVHMLADGSMLVSGIPGPGFLEDLTGRLAGRGIALDVPPARTRGASALSGGVRAGAGGGKDAP